MGRDEHVCPTCGQPVETVVRRHKTLGTWVPLWVAGPCHNPGCGAYDAEDAGSGPTVEDTRPAGETRPHAAPRPPDDTAPPATAPPATAPAETPPGKTVSENS
ncbi:hypothetical protein [Streptomyces sp. CA-179760]|uniref:hypothetical protein n=1 Tax=Streptomyces sp. CA-179760 TaxID=3240054 RepID=UPI003D8B4AE9